MLFYFGQIFYHSLTYTAARKSISVTSTDSEALKPPRTALGQRSQRTLVLAVPRALPHPWQWGWFAAAFQQQHRDSSEQSSDRSWGHLAQSCPNVTKGILPRLSLRGLGNHLLAQNNSHICCSSASCSYLLSQSSFLLRPDNFSCHRILPCNADTCEELEVGYRWRVSIRSGAFRAHPAHNTKQHHTKQINK